MKDGLKETFRKCGTFAAMTAALLLTAVLVIGCIAPLDMTNSGGWTGPIPEGMAAVRINLNESARSTVRPELPPTGGLTYQIQKDINNTGFGALADYSPGTPINITSGVDHVFRLVASQTGNVVGEWISGTINVAAGGNQTLNAALTGITASGQGTFEWDLTLPAGVTGTMTFVGVSANTTGQIVGPEVLATGQNLGSELINAGFWEVTVELNRVDHQTVFIGPVGVHIFQNLTSTYTRNFPANILSRNVYTVQFFDALGAVIGAETLTGVTHGSTIAAPAVPPVSNPPGAAFQTWNVGSALGPVWNFGTDVVRRDLNLHPVFETLVPVTINATVTWTVPAAPLDFDPNTVTFTQAQALAATLFELTITNPAHFTGGFELISPFDGTVLDTAAVGTPTLSFVLNTVSGLQVIGNYEFTIRGTRTETGGVYTGIITIVIDP